MNDDWGHFLIDRRLRRGTSGNVENNSQISAKDSPLGDDFSQYIVLCMSVSWLVKKQSLVHSPTTKKAYLLKKNMKKMFMFNFLQIQQNAKFITL